MKTNSAKYHTYREVPHTLLSCLSHAKKLIDQFVTDESECLEENEIMFRAASKYYGAIGDIDNLCFRPTCILPDTSSVLFVFLPGRSPLKAQMPFLGGSWKK